MRNIVRYAVAGIQVLLGGLIIAAMLSPPTMSTTPVDPMSRGAFFACLGCLLLSGGLMLFTCDD